MHTSGLTIARIHDQFTRLCCREIQFSAAPGCVDGIFRHEAESLQLSLDLALRTLLPLLSHSGDNAAWQALKEAWPDQDSTELRRPEYR